MHGCVCMRVYACVYVRVCVHVYTCVCMSISVCAHTWVCKHVCMYLSFVREDGWVFCARAIMS